MEPSSIVITASWLTAVSKINFSSNGFANRASIMVMSIPFFCNSSDAFIHSCNLAPKLINAIFFPFLIILPLPISNVSFIPGNFIPIPLPLG